MESEINFRNDVIQQKEIQIKSLNQANGELKQLNANYFEDLEEISTKVKRQEMENAELDLINKNTQKLLEEKEGKLMQISVRFS